MDDTLIERRHVDKTGTITGLQADRGRDVLLVRIPDFDEVERKAVDQAERLARDLDLDPAKARTFVHDAAEAARKGAATMADTWDRITAPGTAARVSAEEQAALRDVAGAARRGGADWTPTPDPPEP